MYRNASDNECSLRKVKLVHVFRENIMFPSFYDVIIKLSFQNTTASKSFEIKSIWPFFKLQDRQ